MVTVSDLEILPAEYHQPRDVYVTRIKELLPQFPDDVIRTWFNEHPQSMRSFFDLGYENFDFEAVELTLTDIGSETVFRPGAKPTAELVAACRTTHRRLLMYVEQNGVWPGRPILLDTASSVIPVGFIIPLRRPLHLIEGNHRLALAIAGPAPIAPDQPLPFWRAKIRSQGQPSGEPNTASPET